jgi:hydrogenase expression/formation protein HypC
MPFACADVEFGGVRRIVNMACATEAGINDYVLVHAGIAIARIGEAEAQRVLQMLAELGLSEVADEPPGANERRSIEAL